MAAYPIPPWLSEGANPAAQYGSGLQIGVRIGAEQAAQRYQQQQLLRAQAQDEFERQYKTEVLNLEVDKAMRKQRAVQGFQAAVAQGMDPTQALMTFGADLGESLADVVRSQGIADQRVISNQMAEQRLRGTERTADLRERELGLREKNIDRLSNRYSLSEPDRARLNSLYAEMRGVNAELAKIPAAPSDDEDDQAIANRTALAGRRSALQKQIDRLSGKQPAIAEAAPVVAAPAPQPAAPGASGNRVKVVAPDGKRGSIPAEQLDEALAAGYKQAE